jgi:GNAT superfamily N-acetyltransferase
MRYEIVRYHAGLRSGVVSLMRHLLVDDLARCDAYFRWKHEENPFVAAPVAYVALHEGRAVGLRAFQGARWQAKDETAPRTILCACDLVVEPAHRGAGLPREIMQIALDGLRADGNRIVLSFSASPVTYRGSLRHEWTLIAPYSMWCIDTAKLRAAERLSARMKDLPMLWRYPAAPLRFALHRGFDALDARWRRQAGGSSPVLAREPRPEMMAELAARAPSSGTRHVRDASYYRWRFRNPACEYRFVFRGGPSPSAFLVLGRSVLMPHADLCLVDYAAQDDEELAAMIAAVVAAGGYDRLSLWTATLSAGLIERLAAMGFAARDMSRGDPAYRPGMLVREFGEPEGSEARLAAGAWDLRMVNSDAY